MNIGEHDVILVVHEMSRPGQFYRVHYADREDDEKSVTLRLDEDLTDQFKRWEQGMFGYYSEFMKGNTSFKICSSNNGTISSLKILGGFYKYVREYGTHRPPSMIFAHFLADFGKKWAHLRRDNGLFLPIERWSIAQ